MSRYIIGIDPGKNTGFGVWDAKLEKFSYLGTIDFWTAVDLLRAYDPRDVIRVIVELPQTKHVWHGSKNVATAQRTGVNVGGALREAELLAEFCSRRGLSIITKPPAGKIDAAKFRDLTGYKGATNEHTRDAGMLAYRVAHKIAHGVF